MHTLYGALLRSVAIGAHKLLAVIDSSHGNLCLGFWWWERIGLMPDFSVDTADITDFSGIESEAPMQKLAVNEEVFLCNGWGPNRIYDGTNIRRAGADAAPAPVISPGSGTGLTGDYTAVYTYYDSVRGYETNPVETAPAIVTLTNQSLEVSVTASADTRFDKIRIYRNADGVPATYRLDTEVANETASVQLTRADTDLTTEVSYGNAMPPPTKFAAKTASRIFWAASRPWMEGTATVTNGGTTVTLTDQPPPDLYTRNVEAPFYFQIKNGPRYGIAGISGTTLTLSTPYKEATASGLDYVITGLQTRVWYADLTSSGLVMAESWNPENYFNVGLRGDAPGRDFQDEITGLREYGNRIYAFMKESIWYFDPLISQRKRSGAVTGTPSINTVCEDREGNLLFLGTDQQVYAFNGVSTVPVSGKLRNRFASKDRYALDLMEYSWAVYDGKEGLYQLSRPAHDATLDNMKYVVDIYDDYTGRWTERVGPRIANACKVRDKTRYSILGIDTMGTVHVLDDYENSSTYGNDKFPASVPTVRTSVAGEISPGTDSRGKLAIVFTAAGIKGAKLITGRQSTNATVVDLTSAVTVAAGDSYVIGAWHGTYETGWMDFNEPDLYKQIHYVKSTFIKNSAGFLFVEWFTDESETAVGIMMINILTERQFKRHMPSRAKQVKLRLTSVSELVGFGFRELDFFIQATADV